MIENQTNGKMSIVGKAVNNGERIETRRTSAERKTFLNDGGGTSKEIEDKQGKGNPKENKD